MNNERKGWWLLNGKHLKNPSEGFQVAIIAPTIIVLIFVIATTLILFPMMAYKAIFGDLTVLNTLIPAIAGLFAAPFLIWKLVLTHKQTITNEAKKDIDREVAFTNLYTKSVELLGATREVKIPKLVKDKDGNDKYDTETRTAPNMEVRLGALYALDRLASESEKDQDAVQEVLCAYIRLNSWYNEHGEAIDQLGFTISQSNNNLNFNKYVLDEKFPNTDINFHGNIPNIYVNTVQRPDINIALNILGNRNKWQNYKNNKELDLTFSRLVQLNLINLKLNLVNIYGSALISTYFENCVLIICKTPQLKIIQTNFRNCKIKTDNYIYMQLISSNFFQSEINLYEYSTLRLVHKNLIHGCEFSSNGEYIAISGIENDYTITKTSFNNLDLKHVFKLTQSFLDKNYGNENTIIKNNMQLTRPTNWKPLAPEHFGKGV